MYIASVFAQLEREVIAERIRDNMIELAKTGRWLGGANPLGFLSERYELVEMYENNLDNIIESKRKTACKLIEVPEERQLIERIFQKFLELKSLTKLETYCIQNEMYSKNKLKFSISTLRRILTNPLYVKNDKDILNYFNNNEVTIYSKGEQEKFDGRFGLITYNKCNDKKQTVNKMSEWIVAVGQHVGYIKGIDWIRVQDIIEKNKEKRYRAPRKHDFLLSGILRCSKCGSYMRPKIAQGKRFYYICELKEKSRRAKCESENVNGLTLDYLIVEKLKEIFVPNSAIYEEFKNMTIRKDIENLDKKRQELEKNLNKNKEAIKNLINKLKYMDEEIIDLINEELKTLKKENKNIEKELGELERNQMQEEYSESKDSKSANSILEIINNCFSTFENLDIKLKKEILNLLIENMRGSGDTVEIDLVNTKIEENKKRLFSDTFEKTTQKIN